MADLATARSSLYTIDTADIVREGLCRYKLSEAATGICCREGFGAVVRSWDLEVWTGSFGDSWYIYKKIRVDGERIFSASLGSDWWYVHRIFLLRR